MIRRRNLEITRLTNRNRVPTVDSPMKRFGWLYGSVTKKNCFVSFAIRKVILRFKVMNNPSYANISQNFVDPDSQMPTNFLGEEKCPWSAIGNWFNSPTKNGKIHKKLLKKTWLARSEWWFWNRLLFGIVKVHCLYIWPCNQLRKNRAFDFWLNGKLIKSRRLNKNCFASMLQFLLWNTELNYSETIGNIKCGFTFLQRFCLLITSMWIYVSYCREFVITRYLVTKSTAKRKALMTTLRGWRKTVPFRKLWVEVLFLKPTDTWQYTNSTLQKTWRNLSLDFVAQE